ncbi:MAG: penicillin-binding protein 2 [Actinomycetota bacterium]|nr:penicillin-binding protein 2 [Actinomycetota bacterium]MDP2289431.1 penicillin-binding protein 2 [Actinomycetota bacterium]
MRDRSMLRLMVLGVLVLSLMLTLFARLMYLQVISGDLFRSAAENNSVREIVRPAVRGLILDQAGRPLVSNRTALEVTVDRVALRRAKDDGASVINRLALLLNVPAEKISDRLLTCGTEGAKPPPTCWNGSTYQPVPVAVGIDTQTALTIMERRNDFPGVAARLQANRIYPAPFGVNAAHILGYLGPVTESQLENQGDSELYDRLRRTDVVGRSGLEAQYDSTLRGKPEVTSLGIDTSGNVTKQLDLKDSVAGNYLVSTIDARLQSLVERQLVAAVQRAQAQGYPGKSGAAVVIDVQTGNVLAMASYPTYDPSIWIGGVTKKQYQALEDSQALSSNAIQGTFAPGSTYKVISTAAAGKAGFNLRGQYDCPNQFKAGNPPQTFRNYESRGYGAISLARAIEVSCNTVFYGIADRLWKNGGGIDAARTAPDPIAAMAKSFGLGSKTGIDLPGEATGVVSSRLFKAENWDAKKDGWCQNALDGYPETRKTNPSLADFYTALDKENCADGFRWREGDALNAAIGQGDTGVTPLQMAMVYSAIANGGTVYQPRIIKGVIGPEGKVVEEFAPIVKSKVAAPKSTVSFLQSALPGVTSRGSGETPFQGFPLDQIPVASKTGSAQVTGSKVSTSWFASYAPANNPKYAVVMMVTQGGTGSKTSGPSVRNIYEGLFGVNGRSVNPANSVLVGGQPRAELPKVRSDGTPVELKGKQSGVQ